MPDDDPIHASSVAVDGKAVLIMGASGSGKSALALELLALGATLVADDRVQLETTNEGLFASPHPNIKGLIEARGVGILRAAFAEQVPVALVVSLDDVETDRIPPVRSITLLGTKVPLLHKVDGIHFAPAILQMMRAGRSDR